MNLGTCCSKFGEPLEGPAKAGSKAAVAQNLEKRQNRMVSRNVYQEETWDLIEKFGPAIRKAREQKRMTHEQLGSKVSARVPQLHKIESGHLRPSDDLAKRLERELGIKLLEKTEGGPAQTISGAKPSGGSLTIGDLIKDARKK